MKKLFLFVAAAVLVSLAPAGAMAADDAKAVWDKQCAKCHGKAGAGDTKMGEKMKVKDYTKADVQAQFTDEQLAKVIAEGEGKMPAYAKKLTPEQIQEQVKLIRSFKK